MHRKIVVRDTGVGRYVPITVCGGAVLSRGKL